MAAHERSAEFWDEQGKPDKAEHEPAQQDRECAELERQRAKHKPA